MGAGLGGVSASVLRPVSEFPGAFRELLQRVWFLSELVVSGGFDLLGLISGHFVCLRTILSRFDLVITTSTRFWARNRHWAFRINENQIIIGK